MGRPTKYTPELVTEICGRLATGEPLEAICRDEGMPNPATLWTWSQGELKDMEPAVVEKIKQDIARARDIGYDQIAFGAALVARGKGDSTNDVARDKLIVETDLKLLAKWNPKKYGDSTTIKGDKDNPLTINLAALLDERIAARAAMLAAAEEPLTIEHEPIKSSSD